MATKISVAGDGFNLEREITTLQALRIIAYLDPENTEGEEILSKSAGIRKKRTNRRTKPSGIGGSVKVAIRPEVEQISPVVPQLEGYPDYYSLSKKGYKVVWILALAEKHNVETLRPNEISYTAKRLRDVINGRDINGLTIGPARHGWVAKDPDGSYRILHKGIEFLKGLSSDKSEDSS